jgi:hypothetical protein
MCKVFAWVVWVAALWPGPAFCKHPGWLTNSLGGSTVAWPCILQAPWLAD